MNAGAARLTASATPRPTSGRTTNATTTAESTSGHRLTTAPMELAAPRKHPLQEAFRPYSSSVRTVILPTRWWVSVAPDQSTTAFARSSFVGRSAR